VLATPVASLIAKARAREIMAPLLSSQGSDDAPCIDLCPPQVTTQQAPRVASVEHFQVSRRLQGLVGLIHPKKAVTEQEHC